jgi:hypothetical protein
MPDGANLKDLFNKLNNIRDLIDGTQKTGGKGNTLIQEIENAQKTGNWQGVTNLLFSIGTIGKGEKDAAIDKWNDGAEGKDGLDTVASVNDLLKTEGQRNLNKYETMISTLNNIGSNCVKNLNDLFQYMVQKQIAG